MKRLLLCFLALNLSSALVAENEPHYLDIMSSTPDNQECTLRDYLLSPQGELDEWNSLSPQERADVENIVRLLAWNYRNNKGW